MVLDCLASLNSSIAYQDAEAGRGNTLTKAPVEGLLYGTGWRANGQLLMLPPEWKTQSVPQGCCILSLLPVETSAAVFITTGKEIGLSIPLVGSYGPSLNPYHTFRATHQYCEQEPFYGAAASLYHQQ